MTTRAMAIVVFFVAITASASDVYRNQADFLAAAPGLDFEGFEGLVATNSIGRVENITLPDFGMRHGAPRASFASLTTFDRSFDGRFATEGDQYVSWRTGAQGKSLIIEFNSPVRALGFTMTDALDVFGSLTFSTDGGDSLVILSGQFPDGQEDFFGIVTDQEFLTAVIANTHTFDTIGFDEFYYGTPFILATIDVDPDTVNLRSRGKWITAYISFPGGSQVSNIDQTSIAIVGLFGESCDPDYYQATALGFSPVISDYNHDGVLDLTVKFDRQVLNQNVCLGNVGIAIGGLLLDGTLFIGEGAIRVIDKR